MIFDFIHIYDQPFAAWFFCSVGQTFSSPCFAAKYRLIHNDCNHLRMVILISIVFYSCIQSLHVESYTWPIQELSHHQDIPRVILPTSTVSGISLYHRDIWLIWSLMTSILSIRLSAWMIASWFVLFYSGFQGIDNIYIYNVYIHQACQNMCKWITFFV